MAASSSRGVKICITKSGATGTAITGTISKAKPAVVTATNTLADGDVVYISGGNGSIANRMWVVDNASGTSFELLGSDTSSDSNTSGGTITGYTATDMICLCWSEMGISVDTPSTVSVATYCNPDATLPSAISSAGQITFGGYVDASSAEYAEMILASEDNVQRYMRIALPGSNGYLVAPITFSALTYSFPLDGAVQYNGSGVLGTKFKHLF